MNVLVGRYHNVLTRTPDGWKISRLVFEILWGERRQDATRLPRRRRRAGPLVAGYRDGPR